MPQICLVGYPGAGKSRFHHYMAPAFERLGWRVREASGLVWDVDIEQEQAWLVLDVRQRIIDLDELASLLKTGDALVLMFWQDVALGDQAWWLKQLKTWVPNRPYALVMNSGLTEVDLAKLAQAETCAIAPDWPTLMQFEFALPPVVLEHFTFVLDAMQRDPQIQLWRACGVVEALGFANPVAIELAPSGFYSYDALNQPSGWLRLEGVHLDRSQLEEWLQACYAPGS